MAQPGRMASDEDNDDGALDHASPSQRAALDLLVQSHLRALHDGDFDSLVRGADQGLVLELVGVAPTAMCGVEAVRAWYATRHADTLHERDVPIERFYGKDFVVDVSMWEGRVTGRLLGHEGGGRRIRHRVLRLLVVRNGRLAREQLWIDAAAIAAQLT